MVVVELLTCDLLLRMEFGTLFFPVLMYFGCFAVLCAFGYWCLCFVCLAFDVLLFRAFAGW